MSRVIWKYQFAEDPLLSLSLPAAAKVVCVAMQHDQVTLWIECDSNEPPQPRTLLIVGTGQPIPDGAEHVGTVFDGRWVWHVYEARLP